MPDQTITSSGQLDRVIVLQRRQTPAQRDELGEAIEVWQDLAVVWASKDETAGAEAVRADEVAAQISATFVIWWTDFSPPLNPRDRLLFNPDRRQQAKDGLAYNIRRVTSVGRNVQHRIDAWVRSDQA